MQTAFAILPASCPTRPVHLMQPKAPWIAAARPEFAALPLQCPRSDPWDLNPPQFQLQITTHLHCQTTCPYHSYHPVVKRLWRINTNNQPKATSAVLSPLHDFQRQPWNNKPAAPSLCMRPPFSAMRTTAGNITFTSAVNAKSVGVWSLAQLPGLRPFRQDHTRKYTQNSYLVHELATSSQRRATLMQPKIWATASQPPT